MNNKDKEIKTIAKILNECCNYYDEHGKHLGNKCSDCEYWCDTNNICCSYNIKEAEALYHAGYRKPLEDGVVLSGKQCVEIVQDNYNIGYERGSKETAKEILKELYKQIDDKTPKWVKTQIKMKAKQYGVEVEV